MSEINDTNNYENRKTSQHFFFVEPTPDWDIAIERWKWGWPLHIYGFAVLFSSVSLACVILSLFFRHRLIRHKLMSVTLFFTFGACVSRGLFHVVDPYGYLHSLPIVFTRLFHQLAFPCLTTSFGLIQMILFRITMLDVGSNRLQSLSFISGVTATYFTIIVLTEIIIFSKETTRPMLLVSEGYFIVWSIFLCVSFIYSGFRLSHYTTEAKKARKELSSYSLSKRSLDGDITKPLTMQRLYNPKIKMTDVSKKTFSLVSSDSDSSMSGSARENKKEKSGRKYGGKINGVDRTNRTDSLGTVHFNAEFDERSLLDTSSESMTDNNVLRDIPPQPNIFIIEEANYIQRKPQDNQTYFTSLANRDVNGQVDEARTPRGNSKPDAIFTYENESLAIDNGYMADCEVINNICGDDKISDKIYSKEFQPETSSASFRNNLPDNPSSLSLFRIRQSRMLHKVVQLTYAIAFMLIVACVFQLYAMFGVYGVLGSQIVPEPWPWLTFQTFFRCVELGVAMTTTVVIYLIIGHRTYKAHRKKKKDCQH